MTTATNALTERQEQLERQLELENAIELAVASHQSLRDKQGRPYILHLLRVMLAVDGLGASDLMPAAVLHDSIEDTGLHPDDMPGHGMSARTVELVTMLTKRDLEPYADYIDRVAQDRQASIIKVADLKDNIGRLWTLPEHQADPLRKRYLPALAKLKAAHDLL